MPRSQRLAGLAPALCPLSPRTPVSSFSDTESEVDDHGEEDEEDSEGYIPRSEALAAPRLSTFRRVSHGLTPWPGAMPRDSDASSAPDSDAEDDHDDDDDADTYHGSRKSSYASSGAATTVGSSLSPSRRPSYKAGFAATVAAAAAAVAKRPSLVVPRRQSSHHIQHHTLKRRRESQVSAMQDGTFLLLSPPKYGRPRERCQSISPSTRSPIRSFVGTSSPLASSRRPSTAAPLLTTSSDVAPGPSMSTAARSHRPSLGERRPSAPDAPDVFVSTPSTPARPPRRHPYASAPAQQQLKLASPLSNRHLEDDELATAALPASPSPPSGWRLEPIKLCAPQDSHFYAHQQRSQGGRGDEMSPLLMRRASEVAVHPGAAAHKLANLAPREGKATRTRPVPKAVAPLVIATDVDPNTSLGSSTSSSSRLSPSASPASATTAHSSPATPSAWGTPPSLSPLPSPFPLDSAAYGSAHNGGAATTPSSPSQHRTAALSPRSAPSTKGKQRHFYSTPSEFPPSQGRADQGEAVLLSYEGESWLLCSP